MQENCIYVVCSDLQKTAETKGGELEQEELSVQKEQDAYMARRRLYKDLFTKQVQVKDQRNKLKEEEKLLKKALTKDHDAWVLHAIETGIVHFFSTNKNSLLLPIIRICSDIKLINYHREWLVHLVVYRNLLFDIIIVTTV